MAKSAAKNINSLESQTMVPTATKFGRLLDWMGWALLRVLLVTRGDYGLFRAKARAPRALAGVKPVTAVVKSAQ